MGGNGLLTDHKYLRRVWLMCAGSGGIAGTRKLHQVADADIPTHAGTVATVPPGGRGSHLKGEIYAMVTITLIGSWAKYNNPQ